MDLYACIEIITTKYENAANDLEDSITIARVRKTTLARMINMPYATFYRKLKNKSFTPLELSRIAACINKSSVD